MAKYKAKGKYNNNMILTESTNGINWEIPAPIVGNPSNRELKQLFGVSTIPEVMAKLKIRCENGFYTGLRTGDYIDGLNLNGLTTSLNYPLQAWNNTAKNNRFEIVGFDTYKDLNKDGTIVNTKHHIIFAFVDCIIYEVMYTDGRFKNNNDAYYLNTDLADFVKKFTTLLEQRLGTTLYPLHKKHSTWNSSNWADYKVWVPSEIEVFGKAIYGNEVLNGANNTSRKLSMSSTIKLRPYSITGGGPNGNNPGRGEAWWATMTPYPKAWKYAFVNILWSGETSYSGGLGAWGADATVAFCVS